MSAARESWKIVEVGWPRNEATAVAMDAVCDGLRRPCQCPRRDIVSDLLLSRFVWLVSQPWLHKPTPDHHHARLNHQHWVGNGMRDLQLHPQEFQMLSECWLTNVYLKVSSKASVNCYLSFDPSLTEFARWTKEQKEKIPPYLHAIV
ncbi:hypothetical protein U9M48_029015 [Paspalum notatum var. saurae]|uniref:Uncharacterized protein n=1 Tax=Paspalum notatum var. saurae TaxID=547442 RepID=A0AAQ3X127_PASNO